MRNDYIVEVKESGKHIQFIHTKGHLNALEAIEEAQKRPMWEGNIKSNQEWIARKFDPPPPYPADLLTA